MVDIVSQYHTNMDCQTDNNVLWSISHTLLIQADNRKLCNIFQELMRLALYVEWENLAVVYYVQKYVLR